MDGKLPQKNTAHLRKGGGRPKGVPNKTTKAAKDIIESCATKLGGATRLYEWAQEAPENERAFWTSIFPKLLPLQVNATGTFSVTISQEDAGL